VNDSPVRIRAAAAERIAEEVTAFGRWSLETGGFLLAPRGNDTLSIVAFAGQAGIVRSRDLFQISERALGRLFEFADGHDLYAPAQFHSHRRGPSLSPTDKDHGLRAEGFTSAVVPRYAGPPRPVIAWGWWSFQAGHWSAVRPPSLVPGEITVVEFDEDGARVR
jgi:hypothetical protein